MLLSQIKLWNAEGDDGAEKQQIIGGNPTGISNLDQNRFKWANLLYRKMIANTWFPEKVSIVEDKNSISELTSDEMDALKDTLSFLIYLDSYQCMNLPNIADFITAPAVRNLLVIQAYQEVIHSYSYQYMLEGLFPSVTRDEIYNRWRDNPNLKKRIEFVARIGNSFLANQTVENFYRLIVANFILESIYFYQGFMFFDQLASRNKLVQSSVMIDYIRNDEITHIGIFTNIIRELFNSADYDTIVRPMMIEAAQHEVDWAHSVYGDKILGISKQSSVDYVQHLINTRLSFFGMSPEFSGVKNPYAHLEIKKRGNFFEASAINEYDRAESITGWDDF